ncbi:DUF1642 domain-containing protein [Listeria booriae]|uniref:DUF1642 domain-containing protein n=1 Tax=Listeria booriae TaxID=1552123 RepID=A0A7X0TL33_9LIST|nr:DUF1642 domain-containing protein [Listeria booriae]MBC1331082.1 DUF1642 domain-containing protein [Listeria booriae]MBC2386393.1 DUF1642 domain-containing protein [Listeria booriae]
MTAKFKVGDRVQVIRDNKVEIDTIIATQNGTMHQLDKEPRNCWVDEWQLAPAPALVVVPQWFDDAYKEVIEYNWNEYAQKALLHFIARTGFGNQFSIVESDGTQQYCEGATDYVREHRFDLIRAVLDGYTVEKEALYYVKVLNHDLGYLNFYTGAGEYFIDSRKNDDGIKTQYTETEIKALNEKLWECAVPVEEVSE